MADNSNRKASNAKGQPFDYSTFTAIGAEDLDAIANIRAGLIDHYQPTNSEELFAIERIALARHSLLRTYRMESGLITFGLQKASQTPGDPKILNDPEEPGEPAVTDGQKSSFWMAAGFNDANRTSVWQFFLRYQGQTERFYRNAIEDFERLRRHRGRSPEPTVVEPPPESTATSPPTTEPTQKQPFAEPLPSAHVAVLSRGRPRISHRRRKVPYAMLPAPSQHHQRPSPHRSFRSNSP